MLEVTLFEPITYNSVSRNISGGVFIQRSTSWNVFKESVILTLDGVPHDIDSEHLQQDILQLENVIDIHHIHIRAISTIENELTAHIKLQEISLLEKTKNEVKKFLQQHNIHHSTLEFESKDHCCKSHC